MNQCECVYLASKMIETGLIRPYLERTGVRNIEFCPPSQEGAHWSNYAVGEYEGKLVGIRFGRKDYSWEKEGISKLSHPGIPSCLAIGHLETPIADFGFMVVSHFPAAPLRRHLDFLSEPGREKSINLLLEVVDLIDYIHSQGVVHQDIIPGHVLAEDNRVYIIDFHIWDDADNVSATSDFCGWPPPAIGHFPRVIQEEIFMSGRIPLIDDIAWERRGFGITLQKLIPPYLKDYGQTEASFINKLHDVASYLTGKSERFIAHPKSRDLISARLRQRLSGLHP